jgi:hypothetical protein
MMLAAAVFLMTGCGTKFQIGDGRQNQIPTKLELPAQDLKVTPADGDAVYNDLVLRHVEKVVATYDYTSATAVRLKVAVQQLRFSDCGLSSERSQFSWIVVGDPKKDVPDDIQVLTLPATVEAAAGKAYRLEVVLQSEAVCDTYMLQFTASDVTAEAGQ